MPDPKASNAPLYHESVTFMHRIVYILFLLFEGVLRLLPLEFWCLVGRAAGWLGYYILPQYRARIQRNILIITAESDLSRDEINALAKENFQTCICNFLAAAKAGVMSDAALSKHFIIEGKENVMRVLERGKGCLCAIAHSGNWEILARIKMSFPEVSRFASLYRELDNPLIENLWQERREQTGCEMFGKKTDSFSRSMQVLRENGMLGVLCDQNAGNYGVLVPYFGKATSTTNLTALMQRRTKAGLVPVLVHTIGLAKWKVIFGDEIDISAYPKDMNAITARINDVLSDIGRQSIKDGFWLHDRWKQNALNPRMEDMPALPEGVGTILVPLSILVELPTAFDEAIWARQALTALKRKRPDASFIVVCSSEQVSYWQKDSFIDNVLVKGDDYVATLKVLAEEKRAGIDLAILWGDDVDLAFALRKLRITYYSSMTHPLAAKARRRYEYNFSPLTLHRRDAYFSFINNALVESSYDYPCERSSEHHRILLFPFSSLGEEFEWIEEKWIALVKKYETLKGKSVEMLFSPEDKERGEHLARVCGISSRCIMAGDMKEAIEGAFLVVAVDGFVPAMAYSAGIPVIVLWGGRLKEKFAPLGNKDILVEPEKSNRATDITPDQVEHALMSFFQNISYK